MFKAVYENEPYYIVALHPVRVQPMIVGLTVLSDDLGVGVLGDPLGDGSNLEEDYSAIEFLTLEGEFLRDSADFPPLDEKQRRRLSQARYPHEVAHVLEDYFFECIERWALSQYVQRNRIKDPSLLEAVTAELKSQRDGLGWIAVFDGKKRFLGTLAVTLRTTKSPKHPLERRLGIEIPDDALVLTSKYPILRNGKIETLDHDVFEGLTAEFKRYIIDRKSPIDLMHVLIAFAERTGMSRGNVATRYPLVHNGQQLPNTGMYKVGKYILEADPLASSVYQSDTYRFSVYVQSGNDHVLTATRDQFLALWKDNERMQAKGKVAGKKFLSMAEIMGGVVASPEQKGQGYPTGSYAPLSVGKFKRLWLSPTCADLFSARVLQ